MWGWSSGKRAGPVRRFEELSGRSHSRAMGKGEITQRKYTGAEDRQFWGKKISVV